MEQRTFFSDGIGGGGGLTRDAIARRLAGRPYGVRTSPQPEPGDLDYRLTPEALAKLVPAAVLVPIVERSDGPTILLTKRTTHLTNHAGQVSFPGGRLEAEEIDPIQTALRETEEEIGLERRHVNLIGRLDEYVTGTGFRIVPVVGAIVPPFDLAPDDFEVDEVFEVPLSFILDPTNHQLCTREHQGRTRHFYAMPYEGYYIWGATAGILINLYEALSGR